MSISKEEKKYAGVIFGALFHDIGKFIQKTNLKNDFRSEREDEICPKHPTQGYLTYKHVSYTDGFLTKINSEKPLRDLFEDTPYKVSYHHIKNSSDPVEMLIKKSDWYSSGVDRVDEVSEEVEDRLMNSLIAITSEINLSFVSDNENNFPNIKKIEVNTLSPENLLSSLKEDNFFNNREQYSELWRSFYENFKELYIAFSNATLNSFDEYLNFFYVLNSLLEKYLWCIPSTVKDLPDISLYDHSVTTAAIASVLYRFHEETKTLNDRFEIENNDTKKFLLISGDISGIQKYIFDIKKSSFAAKTLRARSFQIQSLTENISGYILNQFKLPIFCRILNAAGRFQLLLPNTQSVKRTLEDIKKEVNEKFLQLFYGELTFNISEPVAFSGNDFKIENFQKNVLNKLQKNIEIEKLRKLNNILLEKDDFILDYEYSKFTSNQDLCPLCEKHPNRRHLKDISVCEHCGEIVEIGALLPKVNKLRWDYDNFWLFPEIIEDEKIPQEAIFEELVTTLNYFNSYNAKFSSPYYIPTENGSVLTFEELAEKSEGVKFLAMFKADIDNLGLIFLMGLGEKKSISRIATLSRTLHYFFSEYLTYFIKENFPDLYIVFSGGDDICLVGPWDKVIDFSRKFHEVFEKFSGNNKSITLSAGISLFHHNYPIRSVADDAEDALEKSKNNPGKNSITIFGVSSSWDTFFEKIKDGNNLVEKIKKEVITRGMVYRLLEYSRMKENVEKHGIFKDAIWRSKLYYDVARNLKVDWKEKVKMKEEVLKEFDAMINEEASKISVTYAIYKTRTINN